MTHRAFLALVGVFLSGGALLAGARVVTFIRYSPPPVARVAVAKPAALALALPPPMPVDEPAHVAALRTHCAACHQTGVKTSGGLAVFGRDGSLAKSNLWDLYDRITKGDMPPPGRPRLSEAEVASIRKAIQGVKQ